MEFANFKKRKYLLTSLIKDADDALIYLGYFEGNLYQIYKFKSHDYFENSLNTYQLFKKMGINVPKVVDSDEDSLMIAKEYFYESNVLEILAKEELKEDLIAGIFSIYRFARFNQINLDYHPENYIYHNNTMYYISDEYCKFKQEESLEDSGLYYWIYSREAIEHLKSKGYEVKNLHMLKDNEANKQVVLFTIKYY